MLKNKRSRYFFAVEYVRASDEIAEDRVFFCSVVCAMTIIGVEMSVEAECLNKLLVLRTVTALYLLYGTFCAMLYGPIRRTSLVVENGLGA